MKNFKNTVPQLKEQCIHETLDGKLTEKQNDTIQYITDIQPDNPSFFKIRYLCAIG
jgi:hypothetical protein